jgi:hypothetical protein
MTIRCSPVESTFICSVAVPNQTVGKLLLFDIKTKKLEVSCVFCAVWVLYLVLYSISLLNSDAFSSNHKRHSCGSFVVTAVVVDEVTVSLGCDITWCV